MNRVPWNLYRPPSAYRLRRRVRDRLGTATVALALVACALLGASCGAWLGGRV